MTVDKLTICPCCKSGDYYTLYKVDVEAAASELSSSDEKQIIDRIAEIIKGLWGREYANWNICKNCGNGFADPFIAFDSEYYTLTYTGNIFYTPWKWEYERVYRILKGSNDKGRHLLEIGAGSGTFVAKISEELIDKDHILTTEYSEFGIQQIEAKGIRCIPRNIFELNIHDNRKRFNIICMFQVFEHMDRLDEVFETLNLISTEDSDCFIAVPSHKHREFYLSQGLLLDYPPGHLSCFSPSGMENLADRHGWKLIEHFYQPTRKRFQTYQLLVDLLSKRGKLKRRLNVLNPEPLRRFMTILVLMLLSLGKLRVLLKLNLGRYGVSHLFWIKKQKI